MDLFLLLLILGVILIVFFLLSILKKLIKLALVLAIIFIVLFIITGGSITGDLASLKEKLQGGSQVVLLEQDGDIIAGFHTGNELTLYSNLASMNALYQEKDMAGIKGDHDQVYIFSMDALKAIDTININNKQITYDEFITFFQGGQIERITFDDLTIDSDIPETPREMTSGLFAYMYEKELKILKSPFFFSKHYKEGKIQVYKETIFFKASRYLPASWMQQKLNKLRTAIDTTITAQVIKLKEVHLWD